MFLVFPSGHAVPTRGTAALRPASESPSALITMIHRTLAAGASAEPSMIVSQELCQLTNG